ncbi:unnamed protein product [Acanthosepion pharaonis]|uniref:Uncharacterized protein n=1 Tax=Acanthosepion pharaonis TaxID=158019 RepID=A0A812CUE1_ACAPH|nr:unnamed protein product [Sepia pharaonis]
MLSLQPFSESILPSFFPILFHRPLFLFSIFIPKSTILLFLYLFLHDTSSSTSFFFSMLSLQPFSESILPSFFFLSNSLSSTTFSLFQFYALIKNSIFLSFFTIPLHRHLFFQSFNPFLSQFYLPSFQFSFIDHFFFFHFYTQINISTFFSFNPFLSQFYLPSFQFSFIEYFFSFPFLYTNQHIYFFFCLFLSRFFFIDIFFSMLSLQPFSESIYLPSFQFSFIDHFFLFSIFIPKSTILFFFFFLHDSSSSTSFFLSMLSLQPFSESILPSFFPILFHRPLFLFSIFIP